MDQSPQQGQILTFRVLIPDDLSAFSQYLARRVMSLLSRSRYVQSVTIGAPDADSMRDTIARAIYRYHRSPGTFDKPGSLMGELVKNLSIDEAENIRRAIMGEPRLPDDPQPDDVAF
jgi:hypothetical protein